MTCDARSERPRQVLVIEPNHETAAMLEDALRHIPADLVITTTIEDALEWLARRVPDLILSSTFLPPADEVKLRGYLRACEDAAHTQVITLPQVQATDDDRLPDDALAPSPLFRFARKPPLRAPRGCDPTRLRQEVEAYLEQALALRLVAQDRQQRGMRNVIVSDDADGAGYQPSSWTSTALVLAVPADARTLASEFTLPRDRRRASRRRAVELAGTWGVRLDGARDASIVDLSRTGLLVETTAKLAPGRIVDLQLIGLDRTLSTAARLVRLELSELDGAHVRYRVAAAFARDVDLLPSSEPSFRPGAFHAPKVLGDVLGRVLAGANWASSTAALCSKFEQEIAGLLEVREIRIGAKPVDPVAGRESVCFDIPGDRATPLALKAVFPPNHVPSAIEMRLLRSAAELAAVVLTFAAVDQPWS